MWQQVRIQQDTAGYSKAGNSKSGYSRIQQDTAGYSKSGYSRIQQGRIQQDTARQRYSRIQQGSVTALQDIAVSSRLYKAV